MYSNSYCSYKFAPKHEKIGQSSHKEYSNNVLKYLEFTAIINACTKNSGNLLNAPRIINSKNQIRIRIIKKSIANKMQAPYLLVTLLEIQDHNITVPHSGIHFVRSPFDGR